MVNSPIKNLNNDILSTIFDIITLGMLTSKGRRDNPPDIVRAASQVCHRWRGLLLESAWIWGRLMYLNPTAAPQRIDWINEVVRRAESAPLWIYGGVSEPREGSTEFDTQSYFIRLLDSWERIEKLSVTIYGRAIDGNIPEQIRIRFLSRAPSLNLFDVHFSRWTDASKSFLDSIQTGPSHSLFADDAPLLQTMKNNQVAYKLDSPWLSNIREMYSFPHTFTLNDIFILLQRTPNIERIDMWENFERLYQTPFSFPERSKLDLPNLSSISLLQTLDVVARILEYIHPGRLSTLSIGLWDEKIGLCDTDTLSSFQKHLAFYISNYFTSNASTNFLLIITDRGLRLSNITRGISGGMVIEFNIEIYDIWDNLFAFLFDTFTQASTLEGNPGLFQSITHIRMQFLNVKSTLIPKLDLFLTIFCHVKHLETNENFGNVLLALSRIHDGPHRVFFPELHTVYMRAMDCDNHRISSNLTEFLKTRKAIGFHIEKLDLTTSYGGMYLGVQKDLSELEEVGGLEVAWKRYLKRSEGGEVIEISSYACGSGDPEQLKAVVIRQMYSSQLSY